MEKAEVVKALHRMMDHRLFESPDWLGVWEANHVINKALLQMGLCEPVDEDRKNTRNTALGKELEVDLLTVFLGLHYWPEIPMILSHYGLITDEKEAAIYRKWPDDIRGWEKLLRSIVKQAYLDFFNPSRTRH